MERNHWEDAGVGKKLRAIRESRRLTREKLSKASGISPSYLARLELELDRNPSMDALQGIARGLKMGLCDLLLALDYITDKEFKQEERLNPALHAVLADVPAPEQIKLARIMRSIREVFVEG